MILKIFRFIISILLIPACVAVTFSFYKGIKGIEVFSNFALIFILGALSYSILHLLLFKLDFLYVIGHELLHALATVFSGGKVKSIKVSSKKGTVKSTKANFFVILAPYLIPFYTVFVGLLYFILSFFINIAAYSGYFVFFIGFTLMFHLAYTAESIREKQSDLIKTGYLFSISFIYIVNLVIVFAIMSLLFTEASFLYFFSGSFENLKQFYYSMWKQLFL